MPFWHMDMGEYGLPALAKEVKYGKTGRIGMAEAILRTN